jgi:hypothetical protein
MIDIYAGSTLIQSIKKVMSANLIFSAVNRV